MGKLKYTKEVLEEAVKNSYNYCDVARYFNIKPHGNQVSYFKKLIIKYEINTSHFEKLYTRLKEISNKRKKSTDEVFIIRTNTIHKEKAIVLKRALIEIGREYKCELCNNEGIWNNKELKLQIDHIDGNNMNCLEDNLRFLCPNCHSQTENYMNNNTKKIKKCKKCDRVLYYKNKTYLCRDCFLKNKRKEH